MSCFNVSKFCSMAKKQVGYTVKDGFLYIIPVNGYGGIITPYSPVLMKIFSQKSDFHETINENAYWLLSGIVNRQDKNSKFTRKLITVAKDELNFQVFSSNNGKELSFIDSDVSKFITAYDYVLGTDAETPLIFCKNDNGGLTQMIVCPVHIHSNSAKNILADMKIVSDYLNHMVSQSP